MMMRVWMMGLTLLCCTPLLVGAADLDYWRGVCDGRKAGLAQASRYVHATLDGLRAVWEKEGNLTAVERLDLLLLVTPMVTFGPPTYMPFVMELEDGSRVQCPEGTLLTPATTHRKG